MTTSLLVDPAKIYLQYCFKHQYLLSKNEIFKNQLSLTTESFGLSPKKVMIIQSLKHENCPVSALTAA